MEVLTLKELKNKYEKAYDFIKKWYKTYGHKEKFDC